MAPVRPILLLNLVLFGCDPLVAPDYAGEPLMRLKGQVETLRASVPPTQIAIAWVVGDLDDGLVLHHRTSPVPVDGEFPARFSLRVYETPPAGACGGDTHLHRRLSPRGEARVAVGLVLAVRTNTSPELDPGDVIGLSDNAVLLYVEGATLDDGYHLVLPRAQGALNPLFFDCVDDADAGRCMDRCFSGESECFDECDRLPQALADDCWNHCLDDTGDCRSRCESAFGAAPVACAHADQPFELLPRDGLVVRLEDEVSIPSAWAKLRPQDCTRAASEVLACAAPCDDDTCERQCLVDVPAPECALTSVCEAANIVASACVTGCAPEEDCLEGCAAHLPEACWGGY